MPSRDRISSPAQILRQILLHLDGRLEGHRVQMLKQLRQKAEAVAFDHRGCLDSRLMVGEAFFWGQARHPHIEAGFLGVALWIFITNFPELAGCLVQQYDVNVVMDLRLMAGTKSLERPAFHSRLFLKQVHGAPHRGHLPFSIGFNSRLAGSTTTCLMRFRFQV
jgi:hypothetical protein